MSISFHGHQCDASPGGCCRIALCSGVYVVIMLEYLRYVKDSAMGAMPVRANYLTIRKKETPIRGAKSVIRSDARVNQRVSTGYQ